MKEFHYSINGRHFYVKIPEGFGEYSKEAVDRAIERATNIVKKESGVDEVVVKML